MRISNPGRVYFPARGETKLDLARYYLSVGDGIVRALRERPCMMHRFPSGVAGEKVHQKRVPHRLQPRRRAVRDPLLVHLLPGDPGREPVHHARPLPQRAHDAIPDRQVVLGQVQLGLPASREVHPVRIGDPHRPVPDLNLHPICGHDRKLTQTRRAARPRAAAPQAGHAIAANALFTVGGMGGIRRG